MAYIPYLISDFRTGWDIGKEPWLLPADAFQTLQNARVEKGVLEKRLGIGTALAQMKHDSTPATEPITGAHRYYYNGISYLLCADYSRLNIFDPLNSTMIDISGGSDLFSARDRDTLHGTNWLGKAYLCNGVDAIQVFNGHDTTVTAGYSLATFSGRIATGQVMNSAKWVFNLKDYLLFLCTIENGEYQPGRMRRTALLTEDLTGDDYDDLPFDDVPIAAVKLFDYILVRCEHSLWKYIATGNPDNPFRWEPLWTNYGASGGCAIIANDTGGRVGVISTSKNGLLFFDGYSDRLMNLPQMRDIIAQFAATKLYHCFGGYSEHDNKFYLAYPESGQTYPTALLEYSFIEKNFSTHSIACNGVVAYNNAMMPGWSDYDAAYSSDGETIDNIDADGTEPVGNTDWYTVALGRDGKIYKLDSGTTDKGAAYTFTAKSKAFNPFLDKGKQVCLGSVYILVDTDANASFTFSAFKNTSTSAYKSQTVVCSGNDDKHWIHVDCAGEMGASHTLQFYNSASNNRPRIHAIILMMQPGGEVTF